MAGLLARLFGRAEKRSAGWCLGGWGAGSLGNHGTTEPVPPALAQSLSAVLGCVELVSSAIGSLPASLVIDTPDGRQPAPPTAPQWKLLTRPNTHQSWPAFATWMASSILTEGNSVSWLQTDTRGAVCGLVPAPWPWLLPMAVNSGTGARLAFDLVHIGPETALLGLPRRMLDSETLHVKGRSDFGIVGRSVLSRAAGPVREGLDIAVAASATWKNGLRPSGIFSIEGTIDKEARQRFRQSIQETAEGPGNVSRVLIVDRGGKYVPTSMTSVDAEFLATRMFSVSEVCRLFSVPEPLLQIGQRLPSDMSTFVSTFAVQALAPLVNAIEAEFDHSVLPAGMHLVLDLAGLMRGSYSAVVAALCAAVQSGIATPNDGRRGLGWPAMAGGDTLRTGNAPTWPADAKGMPHLGPSPGPRGDGLPEPGNHANEGAAA